MSRFAKDVPRYKKFHTNNFTNYKEKIHILLTKHFNSYLYTVRCNCIIASRFVFLLQKTSCVRNKSPFVNARHSFWRCRVVILILCLNVLFILLESQQRVVYLISIYSEGREKCTKLKIKLKERRRERK